MVKPKTYFRDDSPSDVSGIVVVDAGDEGVRVTENRDDVHWSLPFWMPEREFRTNTHGDLVEEVGVLPDDTFGEVMAVAQSDDL